jgi:hypothetical protein
VLDGIAFEAGRRAEWGQVGSRPGELTDGRVSAGLGSGGTVNSGKVVTDSMIANAVTNAAAVTVSTQITSQSTAWVELASITFTTGGGTVIPVVSIDLLYQVLGETLNEEIAVATKVGSNYNITSVYRAYQAYSNGFFVNGLTQSLSGQITGIAAGAHNFVLLWKRSSAKSVNTIINGRSLFLLETKR